MHCQDYSTTPLHRTRHPPTTIRPFTPPLTLFLPLPIVCVSTSKPFGGNPAGVCLLSHCHSWSDVDSSWMQSIALEMNQAETAFLIRSTSPAPTDSVSSLNTVRYLLRWFTPAAEVDLCGHATLASSYLLFTSQVDRSQVIEFDTRSGILTARALPLLTTTTTTTTTTAADGGMSASTASATSAAFLIELDLPSDPPVAIAADSDEYRQLLPVLTSAFSSTSPAIQSIHRGKFDYLVTLASPAAVTQLTPDYNTLAQLTTRGVGVTARSDDSPHTFVSRFFAPALLINEDPVTGSAHCMLAEYWGGVLGRDEMVGWQASARGGEVRVARSGGRVKLSGQAVLTMRGQLVV